MMCSSLFAATMSEYTDVLIALQSHKQFFCILRLVEGFFKALLHNVVCVVADIIISQNGLWIFVVLIYRK